MNPPTVKIQFTDQNFISQNNKIGIFLVINMLEFLTDILRERTEFGKKGGETGAFAKHYIDKTNLC